MKYILSLCTLVLLGVFAFHTTPKVERARIQESRPQIAEIKAETVQTPSPVETAVVEPPVQAQVPPTVVAPKPVEKPVEPAPAPVSGDCSLVNNYSNWDQRTAYAVCMAESGGNTNASNMNDNHGKCRGSFGLMQLACFWIPNPKNPVANMAKANEIYSRSGWKPWGAYTSGKYKRYL